MGRAVARTTWLTPLGTVDRNNPPIAGLDGVPTAQGLTSQTYYDSNLTDGVGLDNTTGLTIHKLGGGTYSLSLTDVLAQVSAAESAGGAATSFVAGISAGSAVVSINAAEAISVSISDGRGRTVLTATLQPWNGPDPLALVNWSCQRYDILTSLAGFGEVLETRSVDADGFTTRSLTDGAGRTLQTIDQLGKISTMTYDAAGNVLSARDPNGVGYDAVYDELGRMTSQTDTFGDSTSMTYDKGGNVKTRTDAKGIVTTMAYDAQNRLISTTDRLGGVTLHNYNCCRRVKKGSGTKSAKHPQGRSGFWYLTPFSRGQVTSYTYNARGERISETFPDHVTGSNPGDTTYGIVAFEYDPAGRLLRKTDQLGDTVTFNYDLAGRMHQRDYRTLANSPSGTIADSDTFTFDGAGRMLTAVSGRYANTVAQTYDFMGRLLTESLTIASRTYTITHAYDSFGRPAQMTYPNGSVSERTFTPRGQLHEVKYLGNTVDTRTYDDGGRLATSVYLNGAETTWNYRQSGANKDNLLASIVTTNSGSFKIGTYSYTWDANKNKTAETITGSAINGRGFSTGSTGYDAEDRLTAWNRSDSNQNQAWNLSLVGDWNTFNQTGSSPLTQTRTHGPAHEFTSFTGTNSGTLTYDAKGNQTVRPASLVAPALNLVWDFDNRLIGADTDGTPASLEVTYEFDALGRRVARNGPSGNVVYVQSGQRTIADYARGAVASSPSFRYVYGSYIDEPILRQGGTSSTLPTSGTSLAYYHRNQQYSIVALTNHSGAILERYAYTAHGELTIMAANGTLRTTSLYNNRYTYTGREHDLDLNLYHFRARLYDPIAGRFITRDPLGYVDGKSFYRGYFGLRNFDPSGHNVFVYDDLWPPKYRCEDFVKHLYDTYDQFKIPSDILSRFRKGNDYVYCGDCGTMKSYAWRHEDRCYVCLDNSASWFTEQWFGMLIHEVTHCKQFKCSMPGKPIEFGPPPIVPKAPTIPAGKNECKYCMTIESEAYRKQCLFLFPNDKVRRSACEIAGECYSCRIACSEDRNFLNRCKDRVWPTFIPQPITPTFGPGLIA
ncbi:MAG: RHS repeat protein [Pirellulaceae bacterium]|nr:RHS repeat protein [Pirellulaceae bacterium]